MKLKDIKINGEDLLKFFNEHISFDENQTTDERGFAIKFFYKIDVSDLSKFINEEATKSKNTKVIPVSTDNQRSIQTSSN